MNPTPKTIADTVVSIVNNDRNYTIKTKGGHQLTVGLPVWPSVKTMKTGCKITIDYECWSKTGRAEVGISHGGVQAASFGISRDTCHVQLAA